MLKETSQGSVEWSVAGPEAGEGQDTLTAKLLDKTTLREDDTEDVAKGRESDKDRQSALGSAAENVTEERGGDETLGGENLLGRDSSKVGNVDEHVDYGDGDDGDGSSDLESADGVLGLAEGVVGVAVTDETPDDVVESGDNTVGATGGSLECVVEVVGLLVDLEMSAESDEAAEDDDENNDDLDYAESVLEPDTPFESTAVNEEGGGDASKANTTLVPAVNLYIGGVKNVLAKDDGVTGGPTEENNIAGVETSDEEFGLAVDVFTKSVR